MSNSKLVMSQAANSWEGPTYIEDVFSTYLYTGTGATLTITNGIDLAGEGGLVWLKSRNQAYDHTQIDTVRGSNKVLYSNATVAEATNSNVISAFTSSGFTVPGTSTYSGQNGTTYVSWTFRKAPRFFDVVTYTGNGVAGREIAHNLGTTVGSIIIKRTNTTSNWAVYHRGFASPSSQYGVLNNYLNTPTNDTTMWNNTIPDTDVFTVGTNALVNASGGTYVAYLFAHDPLGPSEDGSYGLISCGSFVTSSSATATIDLGWEPQWVLIKDLANNQYYAIYDTMRGLTADVSGNRQLFASTSNAEGNNPVLSVNSKGFGISQYSSTTYIYIAIRRGPMREPTSGTEVFAMDTLYSAGNGAPKWDASMPVVDMAVVAANTSSTHNTGVYSRLTQGKFLKTNTTDAEASTADLFDSMYGWAPSATASGPLSTYPSWMFRRAPGFFDVVAYTGTGSARTVSHNLGVAPEMMWVKKRSEVSYGGWAVYYGQSQNLYLNRSDPAGYWSSNAVTAVSQTTFSLSANTDVNDNTEAHIAYLFATLPGVSKVGSYTGNGSSQTIDCGFTSGARFILIKRTDSTGDWYVWDTARGIVSGNDPHLSLNTTAAEVTTNDTIDPDSSGFIVNQVAATNVNVSSASYIYLAIA